MNLAGCTSSQQCWLLGCWLRKQPTLLAAVQPAGVVNKKKKEKEEEKKEKKEEKKEIKRKETIKI